jgi:succinyl-diaminopimelate desuccinylase
MAEISTTLSMNDMLKIIEHLVEIPSASTNKEACEQCLMWIERYFEGTRWIVNWINSPVNSRGWPNPLLYVTYRKYWTSDVLFLCHVDVVPAKIYRMDYDGIDTIRGRGVSDMKGPLAAILYAMKFAVDVENTKVSLLISTDEEIGSWGAYYALMDREGPRISSRICICPDGGDNFRLVTHEKACLRMRLVAKGVTAHSAYPWLGENAILRLYEEFKRLSQLKDGQERGFIFDSNPNAESWSSTLVPTKIHGGDAMNKIPDYAEMTIDIRLTEAWSLEEIKKMIRNSVRECEVDFFFEQPMLYCPEDSPFILDALSVLENHVGTPIQLFRGHGTSDAHWAPFPVGK